MATYRTVLGLGLFIAALSLAGLLIPESSTSFTSLLPNGNDAVFTLLLGIMLIVLAWAAYFSDTRWATFLGVFGGVLVVLPVVGIFYPMYFGLITSYIRPANVLILLMTGISYSIVALEIDRTARLLALATEPSANVPVAKQYYRRVRAIKRASVDAVKRTRRPRLAAPPVPAGEPS